MPPPKQLDEAWCNWIAGEWRGTAEGAVGKGRHWMKVEVALDGQFLLTRYRSSITEMTEQHIRFMKEKMNLSDKEIEKIRDSVFEELGLQTLDPETGDILAYSFDSWRTILTGRGSREGNREVIRFSDPNASCVRVTDMVSRDKLIINQEWVLPDGEVMVEKGEMTRIENGEDSM